MWLILKHAYNKYMLYLVSQGSIKFFWKESDIVCGFVSYILFVITIQLCGCTMKATIENIQMSMAVFQQIYIYDPEIYISYNFYFLWNNILLFIFFQQLTHVKMSLACRIYENRQQAGFDLCTIDITPVLSGNVIHF